MREAVGENHFAFDSFDDLYCLDSKTLNVKVVNDNDDITIKVPDSVRGLAMVYVSYISRQFDTESYEGDNDSMEYTLWPPHSLEILPEKFSYVTMRIEFTYTELFNNWVFDTSALSSLFENMGKSIRTTKLSPTLDTSSEDYY